jgi:processive 1,2-diacylglycerol beta-glucosyltransferase
VDSITTGFPVNAKFLERKDVNELKAGLGVALGKPVVLVMPIMKGKVRPKAALQAIFNALPEAIVVAICGRSNKLMIADVEELKKEGHKNFIALKHSDNVSDWMQVADVIVSKAGGSTISEAVYMQKPLVIINPIPGQEDYNTEWLEEEKYGLRANDPEDLAEKIKAILANPSMIKKSPATDASEIVLDKILQNQ